MTKTDWQDFEISLIETYRKNPTVENAENIMQHFSDQVKNNPDEISPELQAWVNEKLVEGLGKKQKDNPIGKALGLVRKKGEKPKKDSEHAQAHAMIWSELFKDNILSHALLTVADKVPISKEALQSSFRFEKPRVLKDRFGRVLQDWYLDLDEERFNAGLDTLIVARGKSLKSDEIDIINEQLAIINTGIDLHNEREENIDNRFEVYEKRISLYTEEGIIKPEDEEIFDYDLPAPTARKWYAEKFKYLTTKEDIYSKAEELLDELQTRYGY